VSPDRKVLLAAFCAEAMHEVTWVVGYDEAAMRAVNIGAAMLKRFESVAADIGRTERDRARVASRRARMAIETTRAPEDGRWYAAAIVDGSEVDSAGWLDTESAAVDALVTEASATWAKAIREAVAAYPLPCTSCDERRVLVNGVCEPCRVADARTP
jgi:hypothetical protein